MKISNSKKELARIIRDNGGWSDGMEFSVQNGEHGRISFSTNKPVRHGQKSWMAKGGFKFKIEVCKPLPNWHQAILSREEYFHLYPAPNSDGWVEWKGGECPVEKGTLVDVIWRGGRERIGVKALQLGGAGHKFWVSDGTVSDIIAYRLHKPEKYKPEFCESVMRSIPEPEAKPTIEQLAADYRNAKDCADRKQQEADGAKADAEAKLAELVAAGKELGLVLSVVAPESELVITDWRDLKVGDIIQCVGSWEEEKTDGMQLPVMALEGPHYNGDLPIRVDVPGISCPNPWGINFKFIRRP